MTHFRQLTIDEIDPENLDPSISNEVQNYRMFWPENRPKPTVGWVKDMPSDLSNRLFDLMQSIDDAAEEDHDVELAEFDALVLEISKAIRINRLVHDPAKRAELKETNLKTVLDWLRIVPYSTVDVMALVLGKSEASTRRILNTFAEEGWLIRDEIKWEGSARKKHLFGIASKGLYERMSEGAVEPPPSRTFKRNRVKSSNASHVLNMQLARLYYERVDNPGVYRRYRQDRDLPFFQSQESSEQIHKWPTYPDMIIENSHYTDCHGHPQTIAIEIEQHHKGSERYRALIKAHLWNIKFGMKDNILSARYDRVVYLFKDEKERNNYEKLFHKQMEKLFFMDDLENAKYRFVFGVYGDLVERIRALD